MAAEAERKKTEEEAATELAEQQRQKAAEGEAAAACSVDETKRLQERKDAESLVSDEFLRSELSLAKACLHASTCALTRAVATEAQASMATRAETESHRRLIRALQERLAEE